jgi:hypothetical protein
LTVEGAGGIRQTENHTAEPFVPEPSATEVEIAIRKMKRYKEPASDHIPAEVIQARGEYCILRYITYYAHLEQRRIASSVEGINCHTYSQKG